MQPPDPTLHGTKALHRYLSSDQRDVYRKARPTDKVDKQDTSA